LLIKARLWAHAIYSERDPRNAVIKEFSKELSQE
jgi:citrate synthase